MICLNCGSEVDNKLNFCPNCGQRIINKKRRRKNMIISALILFVIFFMAGICSFFTYEKMSDDMKNELKIELPNENALEYKSIKQMSDIESLSSNDALLSLIEQEQNLKEYFSQTHTQEEKEEIFTTFYYNASQLIDVLNEKIKIDDSAINSPILKVTNKDNGETTRISDIINSPILKITNKEDNPTLELDYTYFVENYENALTGAYKNYLKFKQKEQQTRAEMPLWSGDIRNENITKADIVEYINKLSYIVEENPDFSLWEFVFEDTKIYVDAFLRFNYSEPITKEENLSLFRKVIAILKKDSSEQSIAIELNELYKKNSIVEYIKKYDEWHANNFYENMKPIISQTDMNIQSYEKNLALEKKFLKKANEFKKIDLNDGGALVRYINNYNKRVDEFELLAYPKAKSDDRGIEYGTIFPLLINSYDETIRKLELYTYQKIVDTYSDNYEHSNIIKMQTYNAYYDKIALQISNSNFATDTLKKYIQDHAKRKQMFRDIVDFRMNDFDFSIWFDKLEIYTYKVIVDEINGYLDYSEEINKIFNLAK